MLSLCQYYDISQLWSKGLFKKYILIRKQITKLATSLLVQLVEAVVRQQLNSWSFVSNLSCLSLFCLRQHT